MKNPFQIVSREKFNPEVTTIFNSSLSGERWVNTWVNTVSIDMSRDDISHREAFIP
jgi:hypothetical protein